MNDYEKGETLRELVLLRSEYRERLSGEFVNRDDRQRAVRMIAELSACIERMQQESNLGG